MGCWGMGMAQTDEFCEIYDQFMEEYDSGKEVAEITAAILKYYHDEFEDDDGVLHDVYFALAKAEWMCCQQSQAVLDRVKQIVESGANIEFYRELEATESDLKARQRNLEKFLNQITVPREKPRKRKRTSPPVQKTFPPLEVGDCFAYKYNDAYRVMCILERFTVQTLAEEVSVAILNREYSAAELKTTDFGKEEIGTIFTVGAADFLGASTIKKVAHIAMPENYKERLPKLSVGLKDSFRAPINDPFGMTVNEFIYHCEGNTPQMVDSLKVGDCYAYRVKDGYKFAVILDDFTAFERNFKYIAILPAFSHTADVDFLNTPLSFIAMYGYDALPNLKGWEKVGSVQVPPAVYKKIFGEQHYVTISDIMGFFKDKSHIMKIAFPFKTLSELMNICKQNTQEQVYDLQIGGCYAYRFNDGYKIAIILNRFVINEIPHVLVAMLNRTYSLESEIDYMNEPVEWTGLYYADIMPNMDDWTLKDTIELPDNINDFRARCGTVTSECALKFFPMAPRHSSLTLKRFLEIYFPREEKQ